MVEKSIIYFGTTRKGSGHGATVIEGGFDDWSEQHDIEIALDKFETYEGVWKFFQESKEPFNTIKFHDCTIFGCLKSPDDHRGGSKTLLAVFHRHLSEKEMIDIIKKNPFLKERFNAVCREYNFENIFN